MSELEKPRRERKRVSPELALLESFLVVVSAVFVMFATVVFPLDPIVGVLAFSTSIGLCVVGMIDLLLSMKRIHLSNMPLKKLVEDHTGIVAIWIVCFISLCVYTILWFTLGWAVFGIMDSVEASFTFPAQAQVTMTLMRLVLTWHPIFFFFGMLLWAYNMSQTPETGTQPIGYF